MFAAVNKNSLFFAFVAHLLLYMSFVLVINGCKYNFIFAKKIAKLTILAKNVYFIICLNYGIVPDM